MAKSRLVLSIDTDLPVATLQDILNDSSSRPAPFAQKVQNFFHGLNAGARAGLVKSGVVTSGSQDAVAASKAGTFTSTPANGETIAINGVTITFVNGTAGNNQVKRDDSPSVSTLASRLASAINNSTSDDLAGVVQASASLGVVTVSCLMPGVIGNNIVLADAAAGFAWAGAATALSGGLGRLPVPTSFSFGKN